MSRWVPFSSEAMTVGPTVIDVAVSDYFSEASRGKVKRYENWNVTVIPAIISHGGITGKLVGGIIQDDWVATLCKRFNISAERSRRLRNSLYVALWNGQKAVFEAYTESCGKARVSLDALGRDGDVRDENL